MKMEFQFYKNIKLETLLLLVWEENVRINLLTWSIVMVRDQKAVL